MEDLQRLVDDEFFDVKLYEMILKHSKDKRERAIIRRLLEKEKKDLETLVKVSGTRPRLNKLKLFLFFILYKLFGTTFIVKFAELNEEEIVRAYRELLQREEDKEERQLLKKLIKSTRRYEYMLRSWIKEERLKYMSFMALGVVDGIISLMGTQAGFLGATGQSLFVGVSSLIVGAATAVSMGAAAYLQAKEMEGMEPKKASLYAGMTYVLITLLLTLPYFLIPSPHLAFATALLTALLILSAFTFYTSVVSEKPFRKELVENVAVVGLAAIVGFSVGSLADMVLEVSP